MAKAMFWAFFAPGVVASLLLILTPISEDHCYELGCGLYYGTFAARELIITFQNNTSFPYFAGFIITALICYIVYERIK
jgi:hypothetical protein